jgi:hypothetical protein
MTTPALNALVVQLIQVDKQREANVLLLESALYSCNPQGIAYLRSHAHNLLDRYLDLKVRIADEQLKLFR